MHGDSNSWRVLWTYNDVVVGLHTEWSGQGGPYRADGRVFFQSIKNVA